MVATLNDHLDYFGTTVSIALNPLHRLGKGGQVVLTRPVASDPRVAALLEERKLIPSVSRPSRRFVDRFVHRIEPGTPG